MYESAHYFTRLPFLFFCILHFHNNAAEDWTTCVDDLTICAILSTSIDLPLQPLRKNGQGCQCSRPGNRHQSDIEITYDKLNNLVKSEFQRESDEEMSILKSLSDLQDPNFANSYHHVNFDRPLR